MVEKSLKSFKMTVPQVVVFSQAWEFPFHDASGIWRRIKARGWKRFVKPASKQFPHERDIILLLIKLWTDAKRNGFRVVTAVKEYSLPGAAIRADLYLELQNGGRKVRVFFIEGQRSAWNIGAWRTKLWKYLSVYRKDKKPFRTIICFTSGTQLRRVYDECRDVMEEYERQKANGKPLELFLFGVLDDVLEAKDAVGGKVWVANTGKMVRLVPCVAS